VVEQADVTRRYNRLARVYDFYDAPMEAVGTRKLRKLLVSRASGTVLEVGVGTGKNLACYSDSSPIVGIDVSRRMLARAENRATTVATTVQLAEADVQRLPFDDDSFDTVVATCVFCSVADPVQGFKEVARVVRPGGSVLLLEHVRPINKVLGRAADYATVATRRVFGFRANRRTEENVSKAGLEIIEITATGVWREIVARSTSTDQN
jgi:ubiquinone/menaquinone biosynthesis C-methylase UbiE